MSTPRYQALLIPRLRILHSFHLLTGHTISDFSRCYSVARQYPRSDASLHLPMVELIKLWIYSTVIRCVVLLEQCIREKIDLHFGFGAPFDQFSFEEMSQLVEEAYFNEVFVIVSFYSEQLF